MSRTGQLLKAARATANTVGQSLDNPSHAASLSYVDLVLNELILRDDPGFYLDHIARGELLLTEGHRMLSVGADPWIAPASLRPEMRADMSAEAINTALDQLNACLVDVVARLDEARSDAEKSYLERVCSWEKGFYDHHLEQAGGSMGEDLVFTEESLRAYLADKFPHWSGLRVSRVEPLAGGFSKKTVLFETYDEVNGHQSMVLRAEQESSVLRFSKVTQEFHIIQFMRKAGLPVAEPLWLEEHTEHFGVPLMVSRKAPGTNHGVTMGGMDSISEKLLQSMIATLCAMHSVKPDADDPLVQRSPLAEWLPYRDIRAATTYFVTSYLQNLIRETKIDMTPQLLRVLKWLQANVPNEAEESAIVHLDLALNNVLIDDDTVSAVLDWESVRLGDPADDIITTYDAVSSNISLADFLDRYAAGTGRSISEYRLAYARVAKCALYMVIFLNATRAIHHDDDADIKLGLLAFRFMALMASRFNELIADAERSKQPQLADHIRD